MQLNPPLLQEDGDDSQGHETESQEQQHTSDGDQLDAPRRYVPHVAVGNFEACVNQVPIQKAGYTEMTSLGES